MSDVSDDSVYQKGEGTGREKKKIPDGEKTFKHEQGTTRMKGGYYKPEQLVLSRGGGGGQGSRAGRGIVYGLQATTQMWKALGGKEEAGEYIIL